MLALHGCAAPGLLVRPERVAAIRRLRVVSLGPVPLEVPPGMASAWVAQLPKPTIAAARGVLALSSILMLVDLPEAQRRAAEGGKAVSEQVRGSGIWSPGMVLADEVVRQLRDAGFQVAAPTERAVPGASIDVYANDPEAYMKGVREWWDSSSSAVDHAAAELGDVDAVVEVSLQYAAFFAGALTLILRVKLIDPASRTVIGRARDYEYKDVGKPEQALANEAQQFKRIFGELSAKLVGSALRELGLRPA